MITVESRTPLRRLGQGSKYTTEQLNIPTERTRQLSLYHPHSAPPAPRGHTQPIQEKPDEKLIRKSDELRHEDPCKINEPCPDALVSYL